jgi:hypothetical protein
MHLRKLILFLCLSVADLCLTWHLLSHGEGQVYEGNPLARWWLVHYGWEGLTLFKLTLAGFVVGVTLLIARQRPRTAGKVLAVSCGILAVVVLYSGVLAGTVAACSVSDGGLDPELAATVARSRSLEQQIKQAEAYHRLLETLAADVIARRRTLADAARLLAASEQGRSPAWLHYLERLYPGRPVQACFAANLIYCALFSLHEGNSADEDCARRLADDYRACYGVAFTLPDPLSNPATGRWRILGEDEPPPGP